MKPFLIAYHLIKAVGLRRAIPRLWQGGYHFFRKKLPPHDPIVLRRYSRCQACDVWDQKRDICGYLGDVYRVGERTETLGCWCLLYYKRRIPDAVCWRDANTPGSDQGWQEV